MSIAYVPQESGADTEVRWDTSVRERCLVTRDDAGELATWSIVDAHGTVLRSGTWRVEERA